MGNLTKNKSKITKSGTSKSSKTLVHTAHVLTVSDVENNRSSAYTYLAL